MTPTDVTVTVRHQVDGHRRRTTRITYTLPENIDPDNVDDFLAAKVEHTAAVHQERFFGIPERELVHALRRQVITGILRRAEEGVHRRLADRVLRVLRLTDRQLLEAYRLPRRGGPNSG